MAEHCQGAVASCHGSKARQKQLAPLPPAARRPLPACRAPRRSHPALRTAPAGPTRSARRHLPAPLPPPRRRWPRLLRAAMSLWVGRLGPAAAAAARRHLRSAVVPAVSGAGEGVGPRTQPRSLGPVGAAGRAHLGAPELPRPARGMAAGPERLCGCPPPPSAPSELGWAPEPASASSQRRSGLGEAVSRRALRRGRAEPGCPLGGDVPRGLRREGDLR